MRGAAYWLPARSWSMADDHSRRPKLGKHRLTSFEVRSLANYINHRQASEANGSSTGLGRVLSSATDFFRGNGGGPSHLVDSTDPNSLYLRALLTEAQPTHG